MHLYAYTEKKKKNEKKQNIQKWKHQKLGLKETLKGNLMTCPKVKSTIPVSYLGELLCSLFLCVHGDLIALSKKCILALT